MVELRTLRRGNVSGQRFTSFLLNTINAQFLCLAACFFVKNTEEKQRILFNSSVVNGDNNGVNKMSRFFKHDAAVKAAKESLTEEQKSMLATLNDTFDLCVPVSEQSAEYVELAKKFNATLSENQRSLARTI